MFSSIRRMTRAVLPAIVETVYPKTCAGCGMRGLWLCDLCETTVPPASISRSCRRCGLPEIGGRCGCRNLPPAIAHARSAYIYDGWAASAVKRVKYDGEWSRIEHLAQQMSGLMTDFGPIDGLIPVPLHRSRERSRGFNQSRILAVELGKLSGVPVLDMLRRSRKTESQVSLSGDQRRENVTGAFGVDPAWMPRAGGHYVIVDDVRTTGSTLGACAEALQAVSPSAISVVTFALDMHRDQVRALRDHLATSGVRGGGHS